MVHRVRSQYGQKDKAEKKEGEVTLISNGTSKRKIDSSLGAYVDFKETKK